MLRTKDELLNIAKQIIGDRDDDDALNFIEDLNDTYTDNEDWHNKYNQLDSDWRKRYKERFFTGRVETDDNKEEAEDEPPKKKSFSDLFKNN